jgi:hypothetical protein
MDRWFSCPKRFGYLWVCGAKASALSYPKNAKAGIFQESKKRGIKLWRSRDHLMTAG